MWDRQWYWYASGMFVEMKMYSVYSCRHFFSEVIIQPCKISFLEIKNQLRHSIVYSLAAVNLCRRLAQRMAE